MPKVNKQGNRFVKISISSNNLENLRKESIKALIQQLASERGVIVNTETIIKSINNRDNNGRNISQKFTDEVKIKSGDFETVFTGIDEYYEYKNGTYHLWVLYLVSENNQAIKNIPTLAYKVDNGAWRSLLVPGWAQFYTKQPVKGTLFLAGEAGLLGGGFYLLNRATYNDTRAKEANSVKIKQEYRKRAKNYRTYSYIAFGTAVGYYIYNVVDAFTSKKGKMVYDYKNMKFAVTPTVNLTEDNYLTAGINIQF
ncbi:MAG: hypothetical protein KGV44_03670 [Flavobacteriaceae bacterium]|nr:hypothetical protein [Flavobacteriaceae bacterium]